MAGVCSGAITISWGWVTHLFVTVTMPLVL